MTTATQETFHTWFIATGDAEPITATYAPPVSAQHVQHQHPGASVKPAIHITPVTPSAIKTPQITTNQSCRDSEKPLPTPLPLNHAHIERDV